MFEVYFYSFQNNFFMIYCNIKTYFGAYNCLQYTTSSASTVSTILILHRFLVTLFISRSIFEKAINESVAQIYYEAFIESNHKHNKNLFPSHQDRAHSHHRPFLLFVNFV